VARPSAALSLSAVLVGTLLIPLGLRALNSALPGADIRESYVPTMEPPRGREPFDEETAAALRSVQPEYVLFGDSMAGVRINPGHLSRLTGHGSVGIFHPGSPVAYWYLAFKNFVVENEQRNIRGAAFFFRDDQLTRQVVVNSLVLDRVARDREPELDRVLASNRLGPFSDAHRAARAAYEFDRTRVWLEPLVIRAPAHLAAPEGKAPVDLINETNAEIFALDRLRRFEAADLAAAKDDDLAFDQQVGTSLLPVIIARAKQANIRLAFICVQRRPTASGPPARSEALTRYLRDLRAYLDEQGAYFHDEWGDPSQPLDVYADGDHLRSSEKEPYTERFARLHASFFK
jgi:hypothetical protein